MAKRPILGRGLAALLGEAAEDGAGFDDAALSNVSTAGSVSSEAAEVRYGGVIDLPADIIRPNPRQPRRTIEPEALEELAGSIAEVGIVQPVIVRPVADGYELIAGERRWRAAQKAGFMVIPAIVRQASDVESLELALVENVVRQELNPVDEAYALKVLLEDLGVTQDALAARVGKSRSTIANKVRLLDLPEPVQESLSAGRISEGHGRALLGLGSREQQIQLAHRIEAKGLSVRQVEQEVRRTVTAKPVPPATGLDLDPEMVDELREVFFVSLGVVPRITTRRGGGVIELPFKDIEELQRLKDTVARRGIEY
ncbi:MAG: ParB/RepB/Spo0J family partition protein [Thermoleophilia bacterium]|jgi:ParB family chromosome partitioning protein